MNMVKPSFAVAFSLRAWLSRPIKAHELDKTIK